MPWERSDQVVILALPKSQLTMNYTSPQITVDNELYFSSPLRQNIVSVPYCSTSSSLSNVITG